MPKATDRRTQKWANFGASSLQLGHPFDESNPRVRCRGGRSLTVADQREAISAGRSAQRRRTTSLCPSPALPAPWRKVPPSASRSVPKGGPGCSLNSIRPRPPRCSSAPSHAVSADPCQGATSLPRVNDLPGSALLPADADHRAIVYPARQFSQLCRSQTKTGDLDRLARLLCAPCESPRHAASRTCANSGRRPR